MDFVHRLVLHESQVSDQPHDIQPEGEPQQGQRIGSTAPIGVGAGGHAGLGQREPQWAIRTGPLSVMIVRRESSVARRRKV